MDIKQWLSDVKETKPELVEFITKLEPFISDAGFNNITFEKAVTLGLKKFEAEPPTPSNIEDHA